MANRVWWVYAFKYATHRRMARENFIGGHPHDSTPMPLDYFVQAVVSEGRALAAETGLDETAARKHGGSLSGSLGTQATPSISGAYSCGRNC